MPHSLPKMMDLLLDNLEALGAASVGTFWVPFGVWTLVWVLTMIGLHFGKGASPEMRYRVAQATLLALPMGLLLAQLIDPVALLPSSLPPLDLIPSLTGFRADAVVPESSSVEPASASPFQVLTLSMILGSAVVLMALSAVVQLVRLVGQGCTVYRLRRVLPAVEDDQIEADVEAALKHAGLQRDVEVLLTSAEVVPMTLGMWWPLVVVPASLSREERRLALAHEFIHVQWWDPLAQGLEAFVAAAFALHPAVHRLVRQCDLFREMACDARLLADPAVSRRSYAALLTAFVTPPAPPVVPTAVGMADSHSDVHQRLLAMKTSSLHRPSTFLGWVLATMLLLGGSLTMTVSQALAQQAEPSIEHEQVLRQRVVEAMRAAEHEASAGILRQMTEDERHAAIRAELQALRGRLAHQDEEVEIPLYGQDDDAGLSQIVGELRALEERMREQAQAAEGMHDRMDEARRQQVIAELRALEANMGQQAQIVEGILRRSLEEALQAEREGGSAEIAGALSRADEEASDFVILGARPNPSSEQVFVSLALAQAADVRVSVYDMTGRRVQSESFQLNAGRQLVRLDVSDLASGTYVYRAQVILGAQTRTESGTFTVAR